MKNLKEYVPADSSLPSFGPNHEIFTAINTFSADLNELKQKYTEIRDQSSQVDVVCKAYRDLHAYRLVFLFGTTGLFVLSAFGVMYFVGSRYGELDFVLKIIAGTTGLGLVFECIYLPNKLKELDKTLASAKSEVELCQRSIRALEERLAESDQRTTSDSSGAKKRKSRT